MAPNFLSGGNNNAVKYFEIRVDDDHLVLRGLTQEAASVVLKGTLVLCSSEPLRVQGIHLSLKGEARSSINVITVSGTRVPKQDTTFYVKRWSFDNQNENKKQPKILPAGNHEWPFEVVLSGDLPESVEGLDLSWIIYRMKATVDRGVFVKDIETRKHIRLIRTFDVDSLELAHNMAVSNLWPDKIQYTISAPTKSVVFGTKVQVDFELVPLLKGLSIGTITTKVIESQEITVETKDIHRTKIDDRTVAKDSYNIPEYVETQDVEGQEGYKFSRYIQLPKKLQDCLQTVEEKNILIKHQLKFVVALINPDGHISELRATLPLRIFISPDVRLNEQNELTRDVPTTQELIEDLSLAPPSYNDFNSDRVYGGVDPARFCGIYDGVQSDGFVTPAATSTPFARSRRGSDEELSMDALANNEISASTLRNRLNNLELETTNQITGRRGAISLPATPSFPLHSHISQNRSTDRITPPGSGGRTPRLQSSGRHSPVHIEYNDIDLSRVPSYNTAIHSAVRTPFSQELPDYFSATGSRPPTPPSMSVSRSATPGPERSGSLPESGEAIPSRGRAGGRHAHFADVGAGERPRSQRSDSQPSASDRPGIFSRNSFLSPITGRH